MNTKAKILTLGVIAMLALSIIPSFRAVNKNPLDHDHAEICGSKGCTFKTLFGEESSAEHAVYKNNETLTLAVKTGLSYLIESQQENGGWGAGSHYNQNNVDPHSVSTDPATTAMVGMALLRSGSTLTTGPNYVAVNNALEYMLTVVEQTPKNRSKITDLSGTQIQTKLGDNIDAVMAAQFFNNILELDLSDNQEMRVKKALEVCVSKIESNQNSDGSTKGDGWAGVLQSSLANQALEAADANDVEVDKEALEKSREFQQGNYDANSGRINTDRGAGVMLYSISGSVRASAKEARRAKSLFEKAKKKGLLKEEVDFTQSAFEEIGLSSSEASKLVTSYEVYESAKYRAQEDEVISGFGNNGGEEFISFLQTGESMVIAGGDDWKEWYDNTSGRILSIQNQDGSWSGHHCITSPVFCTATCLLILSIENDIERLQKLGDS